MAEGIRPEREKEFVKRAGFVLVVYAAVHDKQAAGKLFLDRNFVKKAVSWCLRQIGKRNDAMRVAALACAQEIRADGTRPGRWIAADAVQELKRP